MVVVSVCCVSCDGGDPPTEGTLILLVRPFVLEGFNGLEFTSERVEFIVSDTVDGPERRVVANIPGPQTLRLTGAADVLPEILAELRAPVGFIHQIRFVVTDVLVVLSGEFIPVRVPSGPQTGLKILPKESGTPYRIEENHNTFVEVRYDPLMQLIQNRGVGEIEKPTVEGEQIDEVPLVGTPWFRDGFVMVDLVPGTSDEEFGALNETISVDAFGRNLIDPNKVLVKLASGVDLDGAIASYRASPLVVRATRDHLWRPSRLPAGGVEGDRVASAFWLTNTKAPEAWDTTVGSYLPVIAVIDTGLDIYHPDLQNNLFINEGELPPGIEDVTGPGGEPDGLITMADLNEDPNRSQVTDEDGDGVVTAGDLIDCTPAFVNFEDGVDDDGNGAVDDIIGFDFAGDGTLPNPAIDNCVIDSIRQDALDDGEPTPDYHGTFVSGMAGAVGDNGIGTTGMAWNVRILPIRVFSDLSPATSADSNAVLDAIDYVADFPAVLGTRGVPVVNFSIAMAFCFPEGEDLPGIDEDTIDDDDKCGEAERQENLDTWTSRFEPLSDRLVTTAAFNAKFDFDPEAFQVIPAELPFDNILAVTSIGRSFELGARSPRGSTVFDMAAPALQVTSLQGRDPFRNPTGAQDVRIDSGSSFAAPLVAGAAALVLSTAEGALLGGADLANRMRDTASERTDLEGDVQNGRVLDAQAAVGF
jgi:subtilisin family serine protease